MMSPPHSGCTSMDSHTMSTTVDQKLAWTVLLPTVLIVYRLGTQSATGYISQPSSPRPSPVK